MLEFVKEHWEVILGASAFCVSISATAIAFYSMWFQRQHNYKSLKPYIYIAPFDYENRIVINMANEGVGPAIVKEIRVKNSQGQVRSSVFKWLPRKLPGDMNYKEYWTNPGGFVLKSGAEKCMLEIPIDTSIPSQVKTREEIRSILKELTITVDFEDVYSNKQSTYERKLNLFARTDHEN